MSTMCRVVDQSLPTLSGDTPLPARLDGHVQTCLRCQAEVVRYRKMARTLAALAEEVEAAPAGFVATVEYHLDDPVPDAAFEAQKRGRAAAAAGALVAAAGTVVMVRWMRTRSAA